MTAPAVFVDVYPGDRQCDWPTYIAAGAPFHGAIFKLTQGLRYSYASWAFKQRAPFISSPRYGHDLFDGLYHYLDLAAPGADQAHFAWTQCGLAGGEHAGTLPLAVDVERGGQHADLSPTAVFRCLADFAEAYYQLSGRRATLYGGELLRSLGARGLYGCGRSWVALYASELHGHGESTEQFLARTGTDLEHLMLWQYGCAASDGPPSGPVGYPRTAPGCGQVDLSALALPGGIDALRALCSTAK